MNFETAVAHVLEVEGGYVNHPNDPGGETNYGISKRSYPHLDIAGLTREQAAEIYRRDFWEPLGAEDLDPRLALLTFDAAVNHGLGRAQRWLREHSTFESFLAHRIRFYTRLSTWPSFGRGWMNRMARVLEYLESVEAPAEGALGPVPSYRLMARDNRRLGTLVGRPVEDKFYVVQLVLDPTVD